LGVSTHGAYGGDGGGGGGEGNGGGGDGGGGARDAVVESAHTLSSRIDAATVGTAHLVLF
jgi:hypothetical protein